MILTNPSLLMDVLPPDWTWRDGLLAIAAAIIFIATVIKAIADIRTLGWAPFKEKWLAPRNTRRKKLDELICKFDDLNCNVNEKFGSIEKELKTNGGSSLKDMVVTIGGAVQKIQARIDHQDERSREPIFHLTANGDMCYMNAAFRELVDAEEQDLYHQNYLSRVAASDRTQLESEVQDAIAKKMPFDVMVNFKLNGTGKTVPVRLQATPNVVSGGEMLGYFGTASKVD